jgi:hypothetical protein
MPRVMHPLQTKNSATQICRHGSEEDEMPILRTGGGPLVVVESLAWAAVIFYRADMLGHVQCNLGRW